MRYAARHPACGGLVEDDLPDDYPVEEGVGLWCPACRVSWWSQPEPEPARLPEAEVAPEPVPVPPPAPEPEPPPRRRRLNVWPVVTVLSAMGLVVVVLLLVLTAGSGDSGRLRHARPPASPTPPPLSATPGAVRLPPPFRIAGTAVDVRVPRGWHARRRPGRLILTGPRGARVTVALRRRRHWVIARHPRSPATRRVARSVRIG